MSLRLGVLPSQLEAEGAVVLATFAQLLTGDAQADAEAPAPLNPAELAWWEEARRGVG